MPRTLKNNSAKTRKPYPSLEERLTAVDKEIDRLTKLAASRGALIEKTEKLLAERKAAQEKANNDLEKAIAKKKRLVAAANRDKKAPAKKLSPEELVERRRAALAKAREARKAHKAKLDDLTKAIAESGKSIEEVLAELKKNS